MDSGADCAEGGISLTFVLRRVTYRTFTSFMAIYRSSGYQYAR